MFPTHHHFDLNELAQAPNMGPDMEDLGWMSSIGSMISKGASAGAKYAGEAIEKNGAKWAGQAMEAGAGMAGKVLDAKADAKAQ